MSREVLLDLSFLTEDERDLINNVISKDAEVRKAEQSRISSLRKELDELKENGLSEDELESKNENYCARCQTYFGLIWNRGAYCPRCKYKVCKVCRLNDVDDGWICTLCNKVREVKAQSGAWFFQGHKEKNGNLFGSMLVRQSLRRLPAVQPKGNKEPSNLFIEDDEPSNPFTSSNHSRSTERLSGQADLNSNSAQRNGRLGYQYSDESDEEGHDGSLEDNHDDTASDRTLSKGGSESSESLDSDHDETVASIELSPVTTRELTLQAEPNTAKWDGHTGSNVEQQRLPKDMEDEFGISKDTRGIRDRPPTFNQDTRPSGGNVVQKQPVRYTKSDEGTVRDTEKVRPGSVSLDDDMSYVSAPRFNISSKRRQSFGSQPIFETESDEGNVKHRSKSEEYLPEAERMDRNLASLDVLIECKKTSNEVKDQNISDTFGDVFGTDESSYKDIKIDLKDESKVDISQDMFDLRNDDPTENGTSTKENNMADHPVETRKKDIAFEGQNVLGIVKDNLNTEDKMPYEQVAGSSIELSAEDVCSDEESQDDNGRLEFSVNEEDTVCRESEVVVESQLEIPDENANDVSTELGTDEFTQDENETARKVVDKQIDQYSNSKQLSEQDFEIASTDEKQNGSFSDSILNSDTKLARDLPSNNTVENESIPGNIVSNNDDNTLSVFARVKNWERRSTGDGFGAGFKEENRKGFDNQDDEIIQDKDEITIDSSESNKEITVLSSTEEVEEKRQTGDLSQVSNASIEDTPFINEDLSESGGKDPEVFQTSVDLEVELQQGSFEKSDASLDKNSSDDGIQHDFSSDNITVETSTILEKTEMELQQESYDDTSTDNVNTEEVILDEFSSDNITMHTSMNLANTEMELQQESYDDTSTDNVNTEEVILDEFSSDNITVDTSMNLANTEMELQQESYDDTSTDNVNPDDTMVDNLSSEIITMETSLKESEMVLQQVSYDDTTSDSVKSSETRVETFMEKTEMELTHESYNETASDNVKSSETMVETSMEKMELPQESYDDTSNPGEAMKNYSLPKHVTTSEMQVEDFESKTEQGLTVSLKKHIYEEEESSINSELKSEFKSNLDFSSSNSGSNLKTGINLITSSSLKSDTFVENEVPHIPAHLEKEKTSSLEDDVLHKSDDEILQDLEIHANRENSTRSEDSRPEPQTTVKSANKDPSSPESRIDAMRAFSEAFVTTNAAMKGHESRENRENHEDRESHEESGHHEDSETPELSDTHEERDTREDRGYHAGQYALEERESSEVTHEDRGSQEDRNAREDRGYREESEGPDSRRSSELHYEGFHGDNESMISETSGYGTPSVSEDTSSKRTPSISGDEGINTVTEEARRLPSETAPVIVTTEAADELVPHDGNSFRNSSITDFEEDLDVSFSKYGTGLGNRMLKDQLSMGSRESIVSYYSNAGGEVYGKYPVSGEILFGIKYDPKIQEFQIQIHQARDITAVEKKTQTSDPYVKTYLLPDRSRTGKRKSKVKKNTTNPVFDEILTYKITYDEILQRTLWLAVWNHDTFGHNDFLGEVLVPIDQYHQSGFSLEDPEPQWYELCERQPEDNQFSYNGEIVFALKYVPPSAVVSNKKKKKKKKADDEKGELHINIIEATNLMAKDSNGFSDPFCKSYLLPDKSKKSKQKTPVVKKSLNPKWNYHFVYDNVSHEELMDRVLELTIWDFDRGSSNEFLGGVRLGLGTGVQEWDDATSEEQAAWNKMLNNQNDWNQITLILREHMGHHK